MIGKIRVYEAPAGAAALEIPGYDPPVTPGMVDAGHDLGEVGVRNLAYLALCALLDPDEPLFDAVYDQASERGDIERAAFAEELLDLSRRFVRAPKKSAEPNGGES